MDTVTETARRLSGLSRRHFRNAHEAVEWPDDMDRDQWFVSPELISVYGTPTWNALDDSQRKELSFWEAVNFFSLNIHGERSLIQGMAQRLYAPGMESVTEYLHHFLDEENKHSVWFGTFCLKYAGKVYPELKVAFPSELSESEENFLFFARIAVFEEIVDRYNEAMGKDDRLAPVARQINALHHAEETRHLVFGRKVVEHLWQHNLAQWSPGTRARLRGYLESYVVATWREYYNPQVYRDAGLDDPWALARKTWQSPIALDHRKTVSARCLGFFVRAGVLEQEPVL
jgi:hypothetical protein